MKKVLLFVLLVALSVSISGCIKLKTAAPTVNSSTGIFATPDRGETWYQRVKMMTAGAVEANIPGGQITTIVMDPTDTDAIYAGSVTDGLLYSYNGGEGWNKAGKLSAGKVVSIAIDPKDKCNVYAGVDNKVFKSGDCSRTWSQKFNTPNGGDVIISIIVDPFDPTVVYAGATDGTVYKSLNGGQSWVNLFDFNKKIKKMIIEPNQSTTLYALLENANIYKSIDSGASWVSLADNMKDFAGNVNDGFDLDLVKGSPNTLYYTCRFGLVRSLDGGQSWSQVKLITGVDQTTFYAFAASSVNTGVIFLVDDKTLYRSVNGGETWETRALPSVSRITDMQVHLKNDKIVYLGYQEVKK